MQANNRVDFDLYLITDRRQCGTRDLVACVEQALRGGARAVQLREKDLSTRERFEFGTALRRLTSEFRAKLLINGDSALALAIGADGVHLPQDSLPARVCRKLIGPEMLIGVSTHTIEEAREAADDGADFITYGPVYHTPSKVQYGEPVGLHSLRAACDVVGLPVFALGGLKADNLEQVLSAGAAGVAMISAILGENDLEAAASRLVGELRIRRIRMMSEERRITNGGAVGAP
ncbi:MAG: thiamine phosphate synthase [Candidatus Lindowbacteria bacterium]|nr:thiamine phosphate synthase [Candidatus Lindowbacteria bacterium]